VAKSSSQIGDRPVQPGSLVFVATGVEDRFHSIEEDLRVLVFWAPPHAATGKK
jgi:hypothetical protein